MLTPQSGILADPLTRARPARRLFHALIAAAGWALFAYWWWLVLGRTGSAEMAWTAWFVGISLVAVVGVTVLWVVHNVVLFRRKGPRRQVRESAPALRRDTLGRGLRVEGGESELVTSPVVRVLVDGESKVYRPVPAAESIKARLAAGARATGAAGGAS